MKLQPDAWSAQMAGPERFEGRHAHKGNRRAIVTESGEIELRRFLLSSDPGIRERLHDLRDVAESVHERFPEMIGCTFFGSQTKGYANERSDIDAYLIVDEDALSGNIRTQENEPAIDHELMLERRADNLHAEIVKSLHDNNLSLGLGSGIGIRSISKKKVDDFCQGGNNLAVMHLFHMAVGKDIYTCREQIISTLESMGEAGERLWMFLMEELFQWENNGFDETLKEKRRTLYPMTLARGRSYFLRKPESDE